MSYEEKVRQMGLQIPTPPKPVGAYVPWVQTGKNIYTSGQLPVAEGKLAYRGKLGQGMTVEEGYEAARLCMLNCLGVLKEALGSLDRVARVVKVTGFVNSDASFTDQPKVVNGASELLGQIFGDRGLHARSAVGVSSLPLGAAVEIEMVVEAAE